MVYMNQYTPISPPEKGSFPLDHEGECKSVMKKFLECLKGVAMEHYRCKAGAKEYLECRMSKNLMQDEDLNDYGFQYDVKYKKQLHPSKESTGFVAGLYVKPTKEYLEK